MSGKRVKDRTHDALSTILGTDARLQGNLSLDGSVRIDGTFQGILISEGLVTIGPRGTIQGEVEADEIVNAGSIKGYVVAKTRLILEETAVLEGDLATQNLIVVEGARFNGRSGMGQEAVDSLMKKRREARAAMRVKPTVLPAIDGDSAEPAIAAARTEIKPG